MVSETVEEIFKAGIEYVLILVVVEYGLEEVLRLPPIHLVRLNPCCRGIWSRSSSNSQMGASG